ncbi:unnamed protein product [Adineta steineri]|uniref:Uncharacterized protein n=1 Tax=Adineta steineri TaxID=433720 RepID=A0A818PYG5_9BILA|nr:unnamed protein product [Adineta steineri]CAF3631693.1 unnamed protein product [Adineta steineri]
MLQISNFSRAPSQPQVRPVNHRELQENQISNSFHSPSIQSTNGRWLYRTPSQPVPSINYSSRSWHDLPSNLDNNERNKFFCQTWFWIFSGIFCLILIIAIVAIVLGIVLKL